MFRASAVSSARAFGTTVAPSATVPVSFTFGGGVAAPVPKSPIDAPPEQQSNCLHLTGVEGSLGSRINGVYHLLRGDLTYAHSSSAGVTAVYDQSACTWSVLAGDTCVAHWADSSQPASPESLHRFGMFHAENRRYDAAICAFQAAAAAGHIPSHFDVFLYLSETRPGVTRDIAGAFAAAQAGAAAGHTDCVAAMAFCHLKGLGTEVNIAAAHELCARSMKNFSPMASYVQGLLHLEYEAPAALKKRAALPFLQIAASAEIIASASFQLALLLSDVGDEFCDIPEAIRHLNVASSLGMQSAQDLLVQLISQSCPPVDLSQGQLPIQSSDKNGITKVKHRAAPFQDKLDSKFCGAFCNPIYVRANEVASAEDQRLEVSGCPDFEVSPNAKACLAPNIVVMSSAFENPFSEPHQVPLHFAKFDSKGCYINPAPVLITSDSKHVMTSYSGNRQCFNCSMHGPSSHTGHHECSVCFMCSACCDANPTCAPNESVSPPPRSLAPQNSAQDPNRFSVPDPFKEHGSTVLGAYFASQSVWSNGFPVYFQVPRPNQKDQFVIEFHMRPSPASTRPSTERAVGVWELKSREKVGSSECLFNFNTECENPMLTLPPVTLKGDDSQKRLSRIELAGISATLCSNSAHFDADCTDSYVAFRVSQLIHDSIPDSSAEREVESKTKPKQTSSKSEHSSRATKASCDSCVWLDSKSGTQTLSSITVDACPPMTICLENCQGKNASFVNGVYAFRSVYCGERHLLLVYQSVSFGTILGCLVQNNRVSCAISAAAIGVFLQSKDQSSVQPFAFPRHWNLLQTVSPPKPAPRPAPTGFGFGGAAFGAIPAPQRQPAQFGVPFQGHFGHNSPPLAPAAHGDDVTSPGDPQLAAPAAATNQKELSFDCSEMMIRAFESSPDYNTSLHVWPSLHVIADVLKKCSFENKNHILSHIWRHLVHRCGSDAAALTDLDFVFHLCSGSTENSFALSQIHDLSIFLSKTLDEALFDYIRIISNLSDDWSTVSIAVPSSVASFLRTRNKLCMNSHLRKMYHSIFSVLSSRSSDDLTGESSSRIQTNIQLYVEVARVVGEPFGICASDALLLVDPFRISSSSTVQSVACHWDTLFCSGSYQDGWTGQNFDFFGSTVRFPNGPIHCPTLEKFGVGLTERGYLNFKYSNTPGEAWSFGLVPVASLHNSSYLWNSSPSAIGYSFGESGNRLPRFPLRFHSHSGPGNICVGVDAKNRTCSFYMNGNLISSDSVPQSMFPCVIAICGYGGSSFSISDSDVPAEFEPHVATPMSLSSPSSCSDLHLSTVDSIFSSLILAIINGSVDHRQKMLLDSALHSLLGVQDYNVLKSSFCNSKELKGVLKHSFPSKFSLVLDTVTTQCLERLRRSDPTLSQFTVPVLLSFIAKVDREVTKRKASADMKLFYGIVLPVCHRLLRIKVDATEFVAFILDLDTSTPVSSEYFSAIARALLPFMETEEGTLASRILMESISNSHVETFFNSLMLQRSSLSRGISGSVAVPLGSGSDSECALVDMCGASLACLKFKFKSSTPAPPQHFHPHGSSTYSVFIESQLGSAQPSTHVVFNSINRLPSSLSISVSWDKQGIAVFVESVLVCIINASIDNLIFSKLVCSDQISFNLDLFKSPFGTSHYPDWMIRFLKSKMQQSALDSSPITGSPVCAILKYSESLSLFAEEAFPEICSLKWPDFIQRAMICDLIDVHDRSASHDLICSAVNSFLDACQPFLSSTTSPFIHPEHAKHTAAETSLLKQYPVSSCSQIEQSLDSSTLTRAYAQFEHSISLAPSNFGESFFAPTTPLDLQFRSISGSNLISDQQAPNCVQIVYRKPESTPFQRETVDKAHRKISSLPISLAAFCAKVSVKDLDCSDVAFVELIMYTPGFNASNRTCSFQLHACGALLRDGVCVGHIPQFAQKQSVTLSVTFMGTVTFVVDQKVVFEFNIAHSSGAACQIAVSYGGENDLVIGPSLTDAKGLFTIELFQLPISTSNFHFTAIQEAVQRRFSSLSDRLYFAAFANNLQSILSPSVLRQSGHILSLIQRSAEKLFFDMLCCDGLAGLSSITEEKHLIHAVRILCDWMPALPNLWEGPSLPLFQHIQPGSSAARVFASVILSQIQSNPAMPTWCLDAISCALCESFISRNFSDFGDDFLESIQSHFKLNFADWNLCLPPSDARSICVQQSHQATSPVGCGPDCKLSHSGDGNCLLCGRDWGHHAGHNCAPNSRRGSWRVSGAFGAAQVMPTTPDSSPSDSACTCIIRRNLETGLDEFVFNLGETAVDFMSTGTLPRHNERAEERELREFQEFQRFKKLQSQKTSGASLSLKKLSVRCPACFDKNMSLFGSPDSFGIFPGSTVSLKQVGPDSLDQSVSPHVLQPGQTGFVVCTYRSLAFVQGPTVAGIISCEMLQLISCIASSLFFEAPSAQSISDSAFFSDVMATVMKRGTTRFPPALQNYTSTTSTSLFETLFSSFGPNYTDPFESSFRQQSDLIFLCRSASLFSSSLAHVLRSRFQSGDDLVKILRFLRAFGSVDWEETLPCFSFPAFADGIQAITRQTEDHFLSLFFSSDPRELVLYKLISSLSSLEVPFLAHILKHATWSNNFFIPFLNFLASNIATGRISGTKNHLVFSFLQLCVPPGAFIQLRHALLQLSASLPSKPRFGCSSNHFQVSKMQRWIVDLLLPHLGASCSTIIDGQIQSILPHCGWCEIALPGHSAIRLAIPEGLVFDAIYSANVPITTAGILSKLPLQAFFVMEAIGSLLSKNLIAEVGSNAEGFVLSSHFLEPPTSTISLPCPPLHSLGDSYCEIVHAILSCFKSSPSIYEHELFRVICSEKSDGTRIFSGSNVAFVLSKILATGKIVRNGLFLHKIGEIVSSCHLSSEPREFRFSSSSCIRSMVVVVCDELSSVHSLSLTTAGTCESFAPDHALSLVVESFTRIHQDTGADLREVSDGFSICKGNLINTIYLLMFDPKFASKSDASSVSAGTSHTRFVGEGFCPTCLCDDTTLVALPCEHRFCQECLQTYITISMANSSTPKAAGGADRAGGRVVTNICCPSHVEGCPYMIQTADVKYLASSEYSSFVHLICRQANRAMASGAFPTVTCFCGRLIVGQTSECEYECSCGRISSIGDVKNSNGLQNWMAHPFSTCLQEERWKEYTQVGSEARQSLMRTKKCPSCGAKTTKCGCQGEVICNQMDKCPNEACDHMTCGVCSSNWCWVCGRLGSTESRCSYPKHLITQTKELFKEAEAKVQDMENEFYQNSWHAIRFDPSVTTATVLSVVQTQLPLSALAKGDIIIAVNGQNVISSESAQKALAHGWAPGCFLRIQYQRTGISKLLVCQVPADAFFEQDAFVMQRSLIVRSVSDIAASADPDSGLEKSRALLDKVITELFKEPPQRPTTTPFGFGSIAPPPKIQPVPTIPPPVSGGCDVITNASQDPRFKSFFHVASSTPDDVIPLVVADLVAVQKSFLKQSSSSCESTSHSSHFFSHRHSAASAVSATNGEDPSEFEKDATFEGFEAVSDPADATSTSSPIISYVWKSWAFSITSSPKGNLKYVTFWNHNGTLSSTEASQATFSFGQEPSTSLSAPNCAAGDTVASNQIPVAIADLRSRKPRVTRAVERSDKFAGSMAVLDEGREAWLFSCPPIMSPIDTSSATLGRSIQNRPWLRNLKPVFCTSAAEFCTPLLSSSSSAMHSTELDAVLHRYGDMCLVIHGNGDWATCQASQIPSSFEETALPASSQFAHFSCTIPHVGSWEGCGGNIKGISGCAGNGNCSVRCFNCGARSHWTCCGSNDKNSKTCSGSITSLQAIQNDRIFRLVVREVAVPCFNIPGLSGGHFSFV